MHKSIIISFVLIVLHCAPVLGQGSDDTMSNDYHKVGIRADGHFFETEDGSPAYNLIGQSNNHMIDFSGMWIVAKKTNGEKVGFISRENSKPELRSGPIDTLFNKAVDNPTIWNHVWGLSQTGIQNHKKNWAETDYVAPWSISNWPARHNQDYVPSIMAPFVDWDRDNKYDPAKGDYPYFAGDDMMYFIANDEGQEHKLSGSVSMTVEIQGQMYFLTNQSAQVVFARIFVINRSDQDYDSLYFGQYNHFALGNLNDNYVATNVTANSIYGYNGDNNDEGGFGTKLPFAACVFLNHSLTSSLSFRDDDSIRKYPESISDVWNVAKGHWPKGDKLDYAGKGYKESQVFGNYIYPHSTDPMHSRVNWSDKDSKDGVGSRNILGFTGPFDLKDNAILKFDIAFISGLMNDSISHAEIAKQIENVKNVYQTHLGTENNTKPSQSVTAYPNPAIAGEHTTFDCAENTLLNVYDQAGRLVFNQSYTVGTQKMPVPRIPGVYHLIFETNGNRNHFRLLVQ
jgi:hypothetical protein